MVSNIESILLFMDGLKYRVHRAVHGFGNIFNLANNNDDFGSVCSNKEEVLISEGNDIVEVSEEVVCSVVVTSQVEDRFLYLTAGFAFVIFNLFGNEEFDISFFVHIEN